MNDGTKETANEICETVAESLGHKITDVPVEVVKCIEAMMRASDDVPIWNCDGPAAMPPQADAETLPDGELKMFHLCGCAGSIPYVLAEEAYAAYSKKYGSQQTLTRMGERGGFYAEELDEFIPGGRDRAIAIKLQYEASVARIAADSVLVPRAELERLRDAERIAEHADDGDAGVYLRLREVGRVGALCHFEAHAP